MNDKNDTEQPLYQSSHILSDTSHKRKTIINISIIVLVALLFIGIVTPLRDVILVHLFVPTLTPSPLLPGDDLFYIRTFPAWGGITVDGHPLTHSPSTGYNQPLRLPRGLHLITWNDEPFRPITCTVIVPPLLGHEPCSFESQVQVPGRGSARLIAFTASLTNLPAAQQNALTQQAQGALNLLASTDTVRVGEKYVRHQSTQSTLVTTATQVLHAMLHFHLDTDPNSNRQCIAASGACHIDTQDCHLFCTLPDLSFSQPGTVQPTSTPSTSPSRSAWLVSALAYLTWNYTTADGKAIARNQPDIATAIDGSNEYSIMLQITWDGTAWHVVPIHDTKTLPVGTTTLDTVDPACTSARQLVDETSSFKISVSAKQPLNWVFVVGTNRAAGCLGIIRPESSPASAPAALCLYRFGVLLAANDAAHHDFPNLTMADAYEQSVAQQIAAQH